MLRKRMMWMFVGMFTLILVSGCNAESSSGEPREEGEADAPVTITTVRTLKDDTTFRDGDDVNDNVVTRWAEQELGIDFNYLWTVPTEEQFTNKIRLSLSAGKPLPDVFMVTDRMLVGDLIRSGRVKSLDQAIENHASPRLKNVFSQFPQAFYPASMDGERYGIPRFSGGNGSDSLLWIRQDWLDRLNLEPPETLAELETIMEAFVRQDPDGNGKDDTIGITLAAKNGLSTWLADGSFIFGAHGDFLPRYWSKNDQGQVVYGSVQPSVKKGLAQLHEWYENGYLDEEVGILGETDAIESFVSGRSGIMAAPPWAEGWPVEDVLKNNQGAIVQSYPLPSGPDGRIGRRGEGYVVGMFMFNKDFQHMDAFFDYWDAMYGYTLGESQYFQNGLFEGYDYVMQDGEPVYDQEKIPGETIDPGKYFLTTDVPTIPFMLYDLLEQFHATDRQPQNAYEHKLVAKGDDYIRAGAIVNRQNEHRIENMFNGPPTKTMQAKGEFLDKMENETFANIIYGHVGLDAFDRFVEDWKRSGGDQITEEVNAWYESVHTE